MKTEQEQIDEMVKVIKGFDICGLFGRCFSTGANGENTRYITCPECFAEALIKAGYGDVSEYKAEREMLGSQIKVLKQRLNNKYIEIEQLKAENARLLKFCEKQFTFDTTENNKYSIFSSVRKNFANKIEEKLNDIFGTAVDNLGSMQDITDIIDELLEEYEIYDN